ncbi:MAG: TIGR03943 family protein [Anaerolineales bacterium]
MKAQTYRLIQSAILMGLGAYLLVKIFSGTLYYYINQRFLWLVALGAMVFLVLAFVAWRRLRTMQQNHQHAHHIHEYDHGHGSGASQWNLIFLAVPLLLGFLVPAKPLDSSALELRGLTTNALLGARAQTSGVQLEAPSDQRTVLDWIRAFNFASDPSIYEGETADLIGFVYHDPRLLENQFLVGRFAVSCCVADAFAIGMIVENLDAASWAGNSWVHVVGKVQVGDLDGQPIPLIVAASIKEIAIPPQPYLFP